jgi:hypothetical protein
VGGGRGTVLVPEGFEVGITAPGVDCSPAAWQAAKNNKTKQGGIISILLMDNLICIIEKKGSPGQGV